jgi:hypothetical protein
MSRKTDTEERTRFRSERFFLSQDQWYCSTREGTILGPFPRRDVAVDALRDYLLAMGIRPDGDVWDRPGASN